MSTMRANAYLDSAGGNTATINGKLPIALADVPASATLLGTINTTSGTSQTLSGLTLTGYTFLRMSVTGVSFNVNSYFSLNGLQATNTTATAADTLVGVIDVDLATGRFTTLVGPSAGAQVGYVGASGLTTASTSITVTTFDAFDAGSIRVYGVK